MCKGCCELVGLLLLHPFVYSRHGVYEGDQVNLRTFKPF